MDRPGVVVLPPLLVGIALIVAVALQFVLPLSIGDRLVAAVLGLVLLAFGVAVIASGFSAMGRAGTNVSPYEPALAIVADGAFRFTRNPLYVGLMSILVAITLFFGTWWGLIVLIPVFLVLHFGVILREEAYLERKFGDVYRAYKARVRRYL